MALPKFDSFSLQTDNYITSSIEYRTLPKRDLVIEAVTRKPGRKLISTDFGQREIRLTGWVVASSASDLQSKVDDLHTNVTRKSVGTLEVETNRDIEAIVSAVTVGDPHYSQTMVPIEIEFFCPDPFFRGSQLTASTTVTSGNSSQQITVTISGSVFAEPSIVYNAPAGTGSTTTSGVSVKYDTLSETVTWSGGDNTLAYGNFVKFDYENQLILEGSTEIEPTGVFSRWEPGTRTFTTTFSGSSQGGSMDFIYRPRYL